MLINILILIYGFKSLYEVYSPTWPWHDPHPVIKTSVLSDERMDARQFVVEAITSSECVGSIANYYYFF